MSGWQFGGWPPPAPSGTGGAVTFQAVKDALSVADTAVGFNLQSLQSVLDVNGLKLNASNTAVSLSVGSTSMGLSTTLARIAIGLDAATNAQPTAADLIAIGNGALENITTGLRNVAVGHGAAATIGVQTDGTFLGHGAGSTSAANNHLMLGSGAEPADAAGIDQVSIANFIQMGRGVGNVLKFRFGDTGSMAAQLPTARFVSPDDDTVPLLEFQSLGANGAAIRIHAGTRDPNGAVSSTNGAYYCRRTNAATAALYVNRSVGATGTAWSLVTAVP